MCDHMVPRGPDDGGLFRKGGSIEVLLGARRLAIIDLTTAGRQPFLDEDRNNAIVYNGMLYNYRELRRELEAAGETFRSDCDTEVVLRAYGVYGPACVERLKGMFAFAVWDGSREELTLARDRFGIKPLYYSVVDGRLVFASQVKTLLESGAVPARLSARGVDSFLSYGAVSEPLTIIEGVSALQAGHIATWSEDGLAIKKYWHLEEAARTMLLGDDTTELEERVDAAVARHLISDAPLGVFLSGGLDSSVIAALASRHTEHVRAVSVSFAEQDYSEAAFQRLVADRLGCQHIHVELGASELLQSSVAAFKAMDQPSFDAVNTYAVAKAASDSGLTVALSGLGADELLDGYGHIRRVRGLEALRLLPGPLRRGLSVAHQKVSKGPSKKLPTWLAGGFERGASYELLRRLFLPEEVLALRGGEALGSCVVPDRLRIRNGLGASVCVNDLSNYMRNVLLRDADAMSMSTSLEVRVPFLDDELAPWVLAQRFRGRPVTKASLANAIGNSLPPEIGQRKKQGFVVPIASWMRGPLRREVDERLSDVPPALRGYIAGGAARSVWGGFIEGRENWTRPWALYALCRWTESITTGTQAPTAHQAQSEGYG